MYSKLCIDINKAKRKKLELLKQKSDKEKQKNNQYKLVNRKEE